MITASYIPSQAYDGERRSNLIDLLVALIEESGTDFETVVFRGTSGALIAPCVADRMRKHLTVIRKHQEHAHTSRTTEGWIRETTRYIIVDDFISEGETVRTIVEAMSQHQGQLVAVYLYGGYNGARYREADTNKPSVVPVFSLEETPTFINTLYTSQAEVAFDLG